MEEKYPEHEIFSDIGSGINFKRKSFRKMVQLVLQGSVEELVVSHRDRLCAESPLTSLSGCAQSTTQNSWSKIKTFDLPKWSLPTTFSPSFTSSAADGTGSGDTSLLRARKAKILPNVEQAKILKGWFQDARKIYNRVVHQLRTSDMELNKYKIRNTISTPATSEFSRTPSKILHQAAFDAYEAYHSNVEKLKKAKANKKSFGKKKREKKEEK